MAVFKISDQYKYTGRGPLDAKSLIKTYAELTLASTWTTDGQLLAYNGMVVAVWLNKTDTSKNGIYFLHDPAVTTGLGKPDVTSEANWHKLGTLNDFADINEQILALEEILNGKEAIGEEGSEDYQPAVDGLISKVAGLATTVDTHANAIADLIQPKSSTEISVAEDGTLSINELNVNKLVQTAGTTIILSGGSAIEG